MAQVRQGALGFQRELSAILRERPDIKVYSVSPFDLDERRRFKDRFGGDIVYFLNDVACQECERLTMKCHGDEPLLSACQSGLAEPRRSSATV